MSSKKRRKNKKNKSKELLPDDGPTWGLYIPGYSYPSVAQSRLFEKRYPHV